MYKCKYDIEEENVQHEQKKPICDYFTGPKKRKNRYSTFLKENPKFVYRRLLRAKLSAKTKSLNKDCLKQSFEIICLTFTTRFKFDNYFSIFLNLLQMTFAYCHRLYHYGDLQNFFLSSINESHLYLLPAIMINIKQESMSQKISFKQPNRYSQNSPECRIWTLEFQNFSREASQEHNFLIVSIVSIFGMPRTQFSVCMYCEHIWDAKSTIFCLYVL